jgi:hypothetical protein
MPFDGDIAPVTDEGKPQTAAGGGMEAELRRFFWMVVLVVLGGMVAFVARHYLAWRLRRRLPKGLVPNRDELSHPDVMGRFVSLIGYAAAPVETLGTHRLRTTIGLRLLWWAAVAASLALAIQMQAKLVGIEIIIVLFLVYMALQATFYEIAYERDTVTLPRWWFGRTTRNWRDLDAVVERRGWYLDFHFRDGTVVQAQKYIVGYAALREKANAVLREV